MADRRLLCGFGVALCCLFAVTGHAAAQLAGSRTHDGFYFQATAGAGYAATNGTLRGMDVSYTGLALDTSLMIGGSPMAGLAIGGGLMIDVLPSPAVKLDGAAVTETGIAFQYLAGIVGMFADFYPDPADGLHVQSYVGWGYLQTAHQGNVKGDDAFGLLLSVAGGYDFWVGSEWSIGGMLRFAYAPLWKTDVRFTTLAPALLINFTYY